MKMDKRNAKRKRRQAARAIELPSNRKSMINFKLKDLNNIQPIGQEPDLYLSWFWLTDGDLWLKFGDQTLYEYSTAAVHHRGNQATPYNDYPVVRFIEDFTALFDKIRESVPEAFYVLTNDLKQFQSDSKKWLEIHDTDEDSYSAFYVEEYDKLISWTHQRTLNSGHLVGGPHLWFFRHKDKIRIVWKTEHTLENGIRLWSAKDGSCEMAYADFVNEVNQFGQHFFAAMDKQVALAVTNEWGNITLDKQRLVEEQQERKDEFFSTLMLLDQEPTDKTNWAEVNQLLNSMTTEIK